MPPHQRGLVRRLRDVGSETPLTENLVQLLRFEHFYPLGREAQVVVARTAEEQTRLQPLFLPSDVRLYVQIPRSPLALVRAPWQESSPDERAWIIVAAAERMAEVAGLPAPRHGSSGSGANGRRRPTRCGFPLMGGRRRP